MLKDLVADKQRTGLLENLIAYIMGENSSWTANSVRSATGTEDGFALFPLLIAVLVVLICTRCRRQIYIAIIMLPRDLR